MLFREISWPKVESQVQDSIFRFAVFKSTDSYLGCYRMGPTLIYLLNMQILFCLAYVCKLTFF